MFDWIKDQFSFSSKINFKVVALCLIGAATFWFFSALNKDYTSNLRIPLEFQFDSEQNVVFGKLPGNVVVNVSGGGWNLLRKSNLFSLQPLEIPLADPTTQKRIAGASLLPYVNDYLDGQLNLNFIVTDSLYFDIDEEVAKTIAVAVDSASIRLAPDYIIISNIRVDRDSISVTGARRYIDTLSSSLLLHIEADELSKDYDERINLELDDYENIECEPNTVRVEFEVEELETTQVQVPFTMVNFPEESSFLVSDSMVQVSIKTLDQEQDSLQYAFEVLVDYNLVDWEDSTVVPNVKLYSNKVFGVVVDGDPLKLQTSDN